MMDFLGIPAFAICLFNTLLDYQLRISKLSFSVLCISINHVAIHGVPSTKDLLRSGDLLSVVVSIFNGKAHADCCETFLVIDNDDTNKIDQFVQQRRLLNCAERAWEAGVNACVPALSFPQSQRTSHRPMKAVAV